MGSHENWAWTKEKNHEMWKKQKPWEFQTGEKVTLPKLNNLKERVDMSKVMVNGEVKQFIAVVRFINGLQGGQPNGREYDFFCNFGVQDQDVVVVDTVNGLQLATIVGIKKESRAATNWVVDKVDLRAHQARMYRETRRKEVEAEMAKRLAEMSKLERYRKLAADGDDRMATLLKELEELDGPDIAELPKAGE